MFTIFQVFFVERVFKLFDKDGDGLISQTEFIDTMFEFANQGPEEKVMFLFQVYDLDGTPCIFILSVCAELKTFINPIQETVRFKSMSLFL